MGKLDGKTALITGASKGIGEGIARTFVKHGARVVLAARGHWAVSSVSDGKPCSGVRGSQQASTER